MVNNVNGKDIMSVDFIVDSKLKKLKKDELIDYIGVLKKNIQVYINTEQALRVENENLKNGITDDYIKSLCERIEDLSLEVNDYKYDKERLEDENEELRNQVEDLESEKCNLESDKEELENKVDEYEDKFGDGNSYYVLRDNMIDSEDYLGDAEILKDMFTEFEDKVCRSHYVR